MAKQDVSARHARAHARHAEGGGARQRHGREPGREDDEAGRTARDSTSINPEARDPIDPRMPHMPPA